MCVRVRVCVCVCVCACVCACERVCVYACVHAYVPAVCNVDLTVWRSVVLIVLFSVVLEFRF